MVVFVVFLHVVGPVLAQASFGSPERVLGGGSVPSVGRENRDRTNLMSVHVFGEVGNPGTVYLVPNERALDAIQQAGGITANSTETKIELRRQGKPVRMINLIQIKRLGQIGQNPFVQDGDVIFVPFKGPSVTIQGPLKHPGTYEIEPTTSVADLIQMAGGFTIGLATDKPAVLLRFSDGESSKITEIGPGEDEYRKVVVQEGDTVTFSHRFSPNRKYTDAIMQLPNDRMAYPSLTNDVYILGGVRSPGRKLFIPQQRISFYVSEAGGAARLGRDDAIVYRSGGEPIETTVRSDLVVYPGDTVVVGEDKLGPEFWIGFMTTITGLGMSVAAFFGK